MTEVTTYSLEMRSPSALNEKTESNGLEVAECQVKQFAFNRFLYQFVGANWSWTDKLSWSDEQWKAYAENDNLRTWLGLFRGSPAGFYELQQQKDGNVELAYFGLAPNFIGRGMGGYFLSEAIKSAWAWPGTQRVWVHTCTLDHPSALQNYKSRGFEVYHVETTEET
ncbi:MAG: GNAT family N-acetyltransferase [Chloroflexota bacterium]